MNTKQIENIVIKDDPIKNILYGFSVLVLLIVLLVVSEVCYRNLILAPFILLVPAIILSIKWSYILLHRGITNKAICTFTQQGILIPNYFKNDQLLSYPSIQNIRILSDNPRFVDILIHSDEVLHPSRNLHFRLYYPFKKELLQENTLQFKNACSVFKLKYKTALEDTTEIQHGK